MNAAPARKPPRDLVGSGIASLLGLFSPRAALSYLHGRAALLSYAAARRDGPNKRWLPRDLDIDNMNRRDRELVQARARDIARNTAIAGAIDKIVANVIHTGIKPQVNVPHPDGGRDCEACKATERLYARWGRALSLWEKQQLVLRHLWIDGGCIVHRYIDRSFSRKGLPPVGVELLDLGRLNLSLFGTLASGNTVADGIEYSGYTPVALHVTRRPLPGTMNLSEEDVRLPLENCKLIMARKSIGQSVPISWLASVIMTVHNLDEYLTAEEIAARVAAAFCVVVELPGGDGGQPLNGIPSGISGSGKGTDGKAIPKFIEAGRIDTIPNGSKVSIVDPKRPGTTFEPYLRASNRRISCGLGMSYEAFSNDYTGASYSSARSAALEERRMYRMQQALLVDQFMETLWDWFCDGLRLIPGLVPAHVFADGPGSIPVRWQLPGWSWVDPARDATASEKNLQLGLVSRSDLCAEQGRDFEEVLEQRIEEDKKMREAGLSPDVVTDTISVNEQEDEENARSEEKE